MNSTDVCNLWLGTDLTCRMGTRNLPAQPTALWARCPLAVHWGHGLGSRGWRWQWGPPPSTTGCSPCSGHPKHAARQGVPCSSRAVGKAGSASPGALQGSGRCWVWQPLQLSFLPWSETEKGRREVKGKRCHKSCRRDRGKINRHVTGSEDTQSFPSSSCQHCSLQSGDLAAARLSRGCSRIPTTGLLPMLASAWPFLMNY